MTKTNTTLKNQPCIFVEGHRPPNAMFYGKWLLAAGRADVLWKRVKAEPRFDKLLAPVPIDYFPDFGTTAIRLVSQLQDGFFSAVLNLDDNEDELLVCYLTMWQMNFFAVRHKRCRMMVPPQLNMECVANAVVAGLLMRDRNSYLRPQCWAPIMTRAEAKEWQSRVCESGEANRFASGASFEEMVRLAINHDFSCDVRNRRNAQYLVPLPDAALEKMANDMATVNFSVVAEEFDDDTTRIEADREFEQRLVDARRMLCDPDYMRLFGGDTDVSEVDRLVLVS